MLNQTFNSYYLEMNYINRPKECYTQEEWIKYLEESIRELRKDRKNLNKEKGIQKARFLEEIKKLKSREEKLMAYYKWYVDKDHNLTEVEDIITENIKLKSDLSLVIKERDDNIKVNEFFKKTNSELWNVIEWLKEQNKKLKSDLAFKNTMLDNVSAEYDSSQDFIKELKERIRFLEQCLDNKEKVNKSLREENKRLSDFLECES